MAMEDYSDEFMADAVAGSPPAFCGRLPSAWSSVMKSAGSTADVVDEFVIAAAMSVFLSGGSAATP
jgi:hypothetical protein